MTKEEIIKKYPSRSKNGIRYIKEKTPTLIEVMFNGGETLYLTQTKY